MRYLKYLWKKVNKKGPKFFYVIELQDKEVYKSELFDTQELAQADAASNVDFYWLGDIASCIKEASSITFIFKDDACPKEIVN